MPEAVVRRRFDRSISNFLVHYRMLSNRWILYENSGAVPEIIASEEAAQLRVSDAKRYNDLVTRYGTT